MKWKAANGHAAIVAGTRTPMVKAGTDLARTHVCELARTVMDQTLHRGAWPADRVEEVIFGNCAMPADAANPARVAAIQAGVPQCVPAMTVQRNCASGMDAIAQAATQVDRGQADAVLAGGAESMSTIPLLFPEETLERVATLVKAKSLWEKLGALAKFRPRHVKPRSGLELGLTDPLCNMIMGKTAEVLAHDFGILREEQDQFALRSHQRAVEAQNTGRFDDRIVPVYAGEGFEPVGRDKGPRPEQSLEALGKLTPVFDRRDGSVTVGNACQVTDGATGLLVMDAERARAEGLEPIGRVRAYAVAGVDPVRMGLGPVFAMDRLFRESGVGLDDVGLVEINEAFAAQVLACLRTMSSDRFASERLGRSRAIGEIDPDRLNVNGGAIALGHPIGTSGARLVLNLLLEMRRRDVEVGVATLCVGGGQGAAILLERS